MPDQTQDREPINFGNLDLGIVTTEELDQTALSNFLNDKEEPEELDDKGKTSTQKKEEGQTQKKVIPPKKKEPAKEEEEEEGEKKPTPEEVINKFLGDDGEKNESEEGEQQEGQENEEGEDNESKEKANPFPGFAKELVQIGILTLDEGETELEIETGEELAERFDYEKRKGASQVIEAFVSRYGPEYEEMFQSVFMKGVDPIEYLNRYAKISDLKGLDLTDELNQERIVREKMRLEGATSEEIGKYIETRRNYNELEEEATRAHRFLVKKEEETQAAEIKKAEQARLQKAQEKQQFVQSVQKILHDKVSKKEFDGIPVDMKFAQEIAAYVARDKYKVGADQFISEFDKELLDLHKPQNYELKVKMAMLLKMVKSDPTLSKIQKRAVTKESNELFQSVKSSLGKSKEENKNKKQETSTSSGKWF